MANAGSSGFAACYMKHQFYCLAEATSSLLLEVDLFLSTQFITISNLTLSLKQK